MSAGVAYVNIAIVKPKLGVWSTLHRLYPPWQMKLKGYWTI